MAIAVRAPQRTALHAAAAMEPTAAAMATARPTRRAAGAVRAAAEGQSAAAAQSLAGLASVRPSRTHLLRWHRSRQFARLLKSKRQRKQIFEIVSSVTPGMTDRERPSN